MVPRAVEFYGHPIKEDQVPVFVSRDGLALATVTSEIRREPTGFGGWRG